MISRTLAYCAIFLHDRIALDPKDDYDESYLCELFVRSALKVPSINRVNQYFEEELVGKSALCECDAKNVQGWTRFHNKLRKDPNTADLYKDMRALTTKEAKEIRDISWIQHKILAYEVENNINDVPSFKGFLKKRIYAETPKKHSAEALNQETESNTEFNEVREQPESVILKNLPRLKNSACSGSDMEEEDDGINMENYKWGFCDEEGMNKYSVEMTKHALCGCQGQLWQHMRQEFCTSVMVVGCPTHSAGCNIGKSKSFKLTNTTTLEYKDHSIQCSVPSTKFIGEFFLNGGSDERMKKTIRGCDLTIGNDTMEAIKSTYCEFVPEEHSEQQEKIEHAEDHEESTELASDASFGQIRKSRFAQVAVLDAKKRKQEAPENTEKKKKKSKASGEIRRIEILDRKKENCAPQTMESIGTERFLDDYLAKGKTIDRLSTDGCASLKNLIVEKSELQKLQSQTPIIHQGDIFHQAKIGKKQIKEKFGDPRIQSQNMYVRLDSLKVPGLKQLAMQMRLGCEDTKGLKSKSDWVNFLDPRLRDLEKVYFIVIGEEERRLKPVKEGNWKEAIRNEEKLLEIEELKRSSMKSSDILLSEIDLDAKENEAEISEILDNTFYMDRGLVSSSLLERFDKHFVKVAGIHPWKAQAKVGKKQKQHMSKDLKKQIVQGTVLNWKKEGLADAAEDFNFSDKIDEEAYYHRIMKKKLILYDVTKEPKQLAEMKSRDDLVCIGATGVAEGLNSKFQKSFLCSGWIEIVDSGHCRVLAKKFTNLNAPYYTKQNPEGEIQGQTLLGKWETHQFYWTDQEHEDGEESSAAQKLRDGLLSFFTHCRSDASKAKYPHLATEAFEMELKEFEAHITDFWDIERCKHFCFSIRTNQVESFFSTRVRWVPKFETFPKTYRVRMLCCALSWNANHISEVYKEMFGEEGIAYRARWKKNIHDKVFRKGGMHAYKETRGRPKKQEL